MADSKSTKYTKGNPGISYNRNKGSLHTLVYTGTYTHTYPVRLGAIGQRCTVVKWPKLEQFEQITKVILHYKSKYKINIYESNMKINY